MATTNVTVPSCMYNVMDSDPATWSQNAGSGGRGFVIVRGNHVRLVGREAEAVSLACPKPTVGIHPPPAPVAGGPPPAPAVPNPCRRTTNALVELPPPCFGPAGTNLTLVVARTGMPSALAGVIFRQGPMATGAGLRTPPANMDVTVQAGAGPTGLALASGNGIAQGSVYRLSAPRQLCMPGSGNWAWDIFLLWPGGRMQGDVDYFTIQGC